MKKYRLLDDFVNITGNKKLYAIEALMDFGNVKKGDRGGYVEKEENLSQFNNSWIYGNARVYDDAKVYDNAEVSDDAEVYGKAEVYGEAKVSGEAKVRGFAQVFDNAEVFGNAEVFDNAEVFGNAEVFDNAEVFGNAEVCGDAEVCSDEDFYVSKNIWSSGRYFTYTRSNNKWKVGCFYGTGEELIAKAYKDSEVSGREYKRIVEYVEAMYADLEKEKSEVK